MASEPTGRPLRIVSEVKEQLQGRTPSPEEVLDLIRETAERVRARRAAAAEVEVPPELVQPLQEWHGLVKDEARRRIEGE